MRTTRILRQMAGSNPSQYDRAHRRFMSKLTRANHVAAQNAALVEAILRRQAGEQGAPPMPFAKMKADLDKLMKG